MLLDPMALANEAEHLYELGLGNVFTRLFVDEYALVVTPFQKAANRIRETMRENGRHGSCGMGIGETMADSIAFPQMALRARDLRDAEKMCVKMRKIQELKCAEFDDHLSALQTNPLLQTEISFLRDLRAPERVAEAFRNIAQQFTIVSGKFLERLAQQGDLIFEGAQGILIDEWHGFHPYTTWSTATFANALNLLEEIGYDGPVEKIGALRAYLTRHGAGPFPTEDAALALCLPDTFNGTGKWQGNFRVGWFDSVLLNYAIAVSGGVDSLAVTNLDRFAGITQPKICNRYNVIAEDLTAEDRRAADIEPIEELGCRAVKELKPKEELTDLTHQEAITNLLWKSVPQYSQAPGDIKEYLLEIESLLAKPVTIVSYGPTASEKYFRRDCFAYNNFTDASVGLAPVAV